MTSKWPVRLIIIIFIIAALAAPIIFSKLFCAFDIILSGWSFLPPWQSWVLNGILAGFAVRLSFLELKKEALHRRRMLPIIAVSVLFFVFFIIGVSHTPPFHFNEYRVLRKQVEAGGLRALTGSHEDYMRLHRQYWAAGDYHNTETAINAAAKLLVPLTLDFHYQYEAFQFAKAKALKKTNPPTPATEPLSQLPAKTPHKTSKSSGIKTTDSIKTSLPQLPCISSSNIQYQNPRRFT